ncbi:MAG: hypothetical protein Q9221_005914 [Calogaya cf. arnoldii]
MCKAYFIHYKGCNQDSPYGPPWACEDFQALRDALEDMEDRTGYKLEKWDDRIGQWRHGQDPVDCPSYKREIVKKLHGDCPTCRLYVSNQASQHAREEARVLAARGMPQSESATSSSDPYSAGTSSATDPLTGSSSVDSVPLLFVTSPSTASDDPAEETLPQTSVALLPEFERHCARFGLFLPSQTTYTDAEAEVILTAGQFIDDYQRRYFGFYDQTETLYPYTRIVPPMTEFERMASGFAFNQHWRWRATYRNPRDGYLPPTPRGPLDEPLEFQNPLTEAAWEYEQLIHARLQHLINIHNPLTEENLWRAANDLDSSDDDEDEPGETDGLINARPSTVSNVEGALESNTIEDIVTTTDDLRSLKPRLPLPPLPSEYHIPTTQTTLLLTWSPPLPTSALPALRALLSASITQVSQILSIAGDGIIPGALNQFEEKLTFTAPTQLPEYVTINIWGNWNPRTQERLLTYGVALDVVRGLWDLIVRDGRARIVEGRTMVVVRGRVVAVVFMTYWRRPGVDAA